jgi:hypothetical protein
MGWRLHLPPAAALAWCVVFVVALLRLQGVAAAQYEAGDFSDFGKGVQQVHLAQVRRKRGKGGTGNRIRCVGSIGSIKALTD